MLGAAFTFRLLFLFVLVIRADHLFLDGRRGVLQQPDHGAAGHFDNEILAGVTIHAFAHAAFADFGDQARHVVLLDEIVQVVVSLEDNAAAAATVAAAGAALGDIRFAMERNTAFAAVAGAGINFDFVYKHGFKQDSRIFPERNPLYSIRSGQ